MLFTQKEIESELSDIVPRGLRRDVARLTQIYESVIYGMFNADDERKSAMFCFLQIQIALDKLDPDVGENHWQAIKRFRELNLPRIASNLDASVETGNLAKEVTDVVVAHCSRKSLAEQLKEISQVEAQLQKTKKAIIEEMVNERGGELTKSEITSVYGFGARAN